MSVSHTSALLLWGRAAGMCSNPRCRRDLTELLPDGSAYNIGEMAHVIARSPSGPRGKLKGGSDGYANLILLCPTCHTMIDKAPTALFPELKLLHWKSEHEEVRRKIGAEDMLGSREALWKSVQNLLRENKQLWETLGPKSDSASTKPGSNLHSLWTLRKLDRVIPNNKLIINQILNNRNYLTQGEYSLFLNFRMHAEAFESHQYSRIEDYPLFPEKFARIFEDE